MHSHRRCNLNSDEMLKENETRRVVSSSSSSSLSSSSTRMQICSPEILNCLWIHLLISVSKSFNPAKAQSIILPSETDLELSRQTTCPLPNPALYYSPVIGILSHPGDGASGRLNNSTNASYIAASYVKFVESAGARVIPLIYNEPPEILSQKLSLVNGLLFTGGWCKTGQYYEIIERLFKHALERNNAGDHFPLVAICLGFELVLKIVSKDKNILERFNATDQSSTLQFTENVKLEGTAFQRFPPQLLKKLSTECLVMQNHQYGISLEKFRDTSALSNFFDILTTSTDKDDKVYVSTIQAYNYPVTGFQWHPEKNAFEWGLPMIPHTEDAVQVTQQIANFFISEARKSLNRPPTREVLDNLIYNYSPTYCGKAGKGYDEVYIFS